MSDPFDRLRSTSGTSTPDIDAIRSRARRIERRRYVGLGGGALAILLIAMIGVMVGTGPNDDSARRLAQSDTFDEASAEPTAEAERREIESTPQAARAFGGSAAAGGRVAEPDQSGGSAPAPGAAPESGDTSSARAAPSGGGFEVTLQVNDAMAGPRRGVGFTLRACNRSSQTVERTFESGQRYDFEVSRGGDLVWRWSDGQFFTQVYGQEKWEPGECKSYSEFWDGTNSNGSPAPPGQYQAVGVLTSSPPLRTSAKSFCLDTC